MPSTYTLNNGIELIATGEQSGTWGDTTNTNLELLDTALDGQVTVTLASAGTSGSPNTLPISDGAASNGRNRMVIVNDGTDLGATAYVQLIPNDAEKIIYVRNSLSGSRSILLFQGTYNASNDYEVPAGTTAVIFFDGAGSGAVAANVFNNAHFDAMNIVGNVDVGGNVDVTGTLAVTSTSTFSDDVTLTGASYNVVWDKSDNALEFADNAKAIFGAGSDLQIWHSGTSSFIKDAGTGNLNIQAENLVMENTSGTDYITGINGGAVTLFNNGSAKLATTATGVDITGGFTATSGSTITTADNLTQLTLISTDEDASEGPRLDLRRDSASPASGDLIGTLRFLGDDDSGQATVYGEIQLESDTVTAGAIDGQMRLMIRNNGNLRNALVLDNTQNIFNDSGDDVDFRIESTGNTHAFFLEGSSGNVGIGTSSPNKSSSSTALTVNTGTAANYSALELSSGDTLNWHINANNSDVYDVTAGTRNRIFYTNGSERMRIDSSGNVGIGTSSLTGKTHIYKSSVNSAIIGTSYNGHYFESQSDDATDGFEIYQQHGSNTTRNSFIINDNRTGSKSAAFVVRGDGNVGVSTGSPSFPLDLKKDGGAAALTARIYNEGTDAADDAVLRIGIAGTTGSSSIFFGDGDNSFVGRLFYDHNNDAMITYVNGSEVMRINSSGNVGINTTNPEATLHINDIGTTGPAIFIENAGATEGDITWDSNEILQVGTWNQSSNSFTELMTINSAGRVNFAETGDIEVGRAEDQTTYDSGERGITVYAGAVGDNVLLFARNNADGSPCYRAQVGGTTTSEIEANGDYQSATNSYGSTSDQTLKENIVASGSQWDDLKAVQVKKFSYIADNLDEANMIGVIAQDLEASGMSGLVGSMDHGDGTMVKTVKYSILYMKAIKALQEAMERIETLETKVATLEGN